jgi:endonuclease/exonuclease/phosphatase family metal-dependent hydrolase
MYLIIIPILIFIIFLILAPWGNRLKSGTQPFTNKVAYSFNSGPIKVMSWNLAYFYGPGSEGFNYKPESYEHYIKNLDKAISIIKSENPDIILLQEIDFNSHKSHGIDQLEYLAKELNLNYAKATSWKLNYLPYPGLNIKKHFKNINSGSAVLTKFKIKNNYQYLFEKPKDNGFLTNLFYVYRYIHDVTVEIGNKEYSVLNIHLEAFRKSARLIQSKVVKDYIQRKENLLVVGGDFNTLPLNASKKDGFYGLEFENYHNDNTYETITSVIKDSLPLDKYLSNESKYFTFSSKKLERKLDYIFHPQGITSNNFFVKFSEVSDHLPVFVELVFKH